MAKTAPKGSRKRHVPQRTCVVCRSTADKRTLMRLVRTPDDGVHVDPTGKQNGRGAYLCDQRACWERALETDVLAKALRTTLTEADRERIRAAQPRSDLG
ncbi:MAG TPA: YlxR family protein [Aggregatilinea sp.]|uniref:RNase P modulator RnpM n=1 Tax=Aggregatilinea sp. TaxID=2806333 RepID=UPI002CC21855|nr:YlxR family protein [Aggregatilinea sp.]